MLLCLGTVAESVADKFRGHLSIESQWYRFTDSITDHRQFKRDLTKCPMFSLRPYTQHFMSTPELGLFLEPNHRGSNHPGALLRLLTRFFCIGSNEFYDSVYQEENPDSTAMSPAVQQSNSIIENINLIYSSIREKHRINAPNISEYLSEITQHIVCPLLRPEMRGYQMNAVNWMLDREKRPQYFPSEFVTITRQLPSHFPTMYYNRRTGEVHAEPPGDQLIPSGGILADEMGLGKTVELLALIDAHRCPLPIRVDKVSETLELIFDQCPADQLWCVCGESRPLHKKPLVQCVQCRLFQHMGCISAEINCVVLPYRCPVCCQSHFGENLIVVPGTLIVIPTAIQAQWVKEYRRHMIADESSILVYHGVKDQWMDPRNFSSFNVVITNFSVLSAELHFMDGRGTSGRNIRPRFMPKRSPLKMVKWWRVCVDEAQMVETLLNRPAMMVKTLPAVHRWSVTGTPMEKSIDHLFGLLHFLGCAPFDDKLMWNWLANQFRGGNVHALVDVLQRIMWRTCKASVQDSLGIPPQTFVTHMVLMTDLQEFFYNTQHAQSAELFREKLAKMSDTDRLVSQMNANTLKAIMEPMRKLRQDCVVPSAIVKPFQSDGNQMMGKLKLLPPAKLHQYLLANHEKSCKNALRTVVSSLNGIGALHVSNGDYDLAIEQYDRVLELADTYKGNIGVDSLLQIHALHNVLDVYKLLHVQDTDIQATYAEKLDKLLDNYLRNNLNLIMKTAKKLRDTQHSITEMDKELEPESPTWWYILLNENFSEKETQSVLDRVNESLHTGNAQESFTSISGLKMVLADWFNRIQCKRSIVGAAIEDLDFLVRSIQQRKDMSINETQRLDDFVVHATRCHLRPLESGAHNTNADTVCQMCQIRRKLVKYECILFDKQLEKEADDAVGTWNPTFQETFLRSLYHAHRNNSKPQGTLLRWGRAQLAMLDEIKSEYKDFSSYWVELNYAVGALDELTMCKSRLHVGADAAAGQLLTMTFQKNSAYREFVRLQGILKYLRHIQGESREMDVCPICKMLPSAKFALLECGHHVCTLCLMQLRMYNATNFDQIQCAVCRNIQLPADIYLVSCAPPTNSNAESTLPVATGDYSPKLIAIVSNVLQLLAQDASVKVLIFSHWESILSELLGALTENGVIALMKSPSFQQSIDQFKCVTMNVTCLLLPLARGSKGLNLIEATHVFLVEPILDPSEELQAIGRVHRIGQTKPTTVHRFILSKTIEETIHNTITNDSSGMWRSKMVTLEHLEQLFNLTTS